MLNTYVPAPPMRLAPPIVFTRTMSHSVNPADTAFTRCGRPTSAMGTLDSTWRSREKKRLPCRVCWLEGEKARERAYQQECGVVAGRHVEGQVGYPRGMTAIVDPLTPRQRQITDLFLGGKTYKEVAAECGISPETVNPTLKAVRAKVGADGISREALKAALEARG